MYVTYDDFLIEIGKAGLTVSRFANLLGMNPNSISNYAKGEVPSHLAIISSLLSELSKNGIEFEEVFERIGLQKKRPRGGPMQKGFSHDEQGRLELGQ